MRRVNDTNVLIIESRENVTAPFSRLCNLQNIKSDTAGNGEVGLLMALSPKYDVIIVDLEITMRCGLEIIRHVRAHGYKTPILMIASKRTEQECAKGYAIGANDHVEFPFAFKEFFAHVKALARLYRERIHSDTFCFLDLKLNTKCNLLTVDGHENHLKNRQQRVMALLMKWADKPLTRAQIIDYCWGFDAEILENSMEIQIYYLRNIISKSASEIVTIHGIGYMLTQRALEAELN